MSKKLRVRYYSFKHKFEGFQLVQEKRWWGWKTLERIDIPSHVVISIGCFGDTGGWISPVVEKYGHYDRNGNITPNEKSS